MPELPEVAALADMLQRRAVGRTVARIDVAAVHVVKTVDPPLHRLVGEVVTGALRRGKFLGLEVGGAYLVTHLARAGWLRWHEAVPARPARPSRSPVALRVAFDGGSGFDLTEQGTQKRLAVYCVTDPADVPGIARLGADPLADGFTEQAFLRLLAGAGRAQLKGVLTDQSLVAGIGNAYSDEILHAARLSPFKPASGLSPEEGQRLYAAVVTTLRSALGRVDGGPPDALKDAKRAGLSVHGREGQPCPVCGDVVRSVFFAQTALQYCPTCQTGGHRLADRRLSRLLR